MQRIPTLRSREWFDGPEYYNFARRAFLRAEGFTRDDVGNKPIVGICNSWSELNNCNAHLRQVAEAVKRGVWAAGGLPLEFPTISLGEMFMRPTTMLYRNLMAMDVEESIRANPIDGVVLLCGCDKTTPAQLMGAASADVPAIVVTGGPTLTGNWRGRRIGSGTDGRKIFDLYRSGQIGDEELAEVEGCLARSAGHCTVMGTASTMASLAEAMGMTLPGCAAIPAPDSRRLAIAELSGRRIVDMVWEDLRPSRVITRQSLENAVTVQMALGGSTNAVVHLIAIAGRLGIELTLDDFDRVSRTTPWLVNVKPSGEFFMEEFFEAGGVPVVMRELLPRLHGDSITVNGQTIAQNVCNSDCFNTNVVRRMDQPLHPEGGTAILYGNIAPDGAVIKPTAASGHLLQHRGRAFVFENYKHMRQSIDSEDLAVDEHSVLVMKSCGPKGAPGFPEWGHIPMPKKLLKSGLTDIVRMSDARMSGTSFGTVVLHIAPESAIGGPLAIVETGDEIVLDVPSRGIDVNLPPGEIERRLSLFEAPPPHYERGYGKMFLDHIEQANLGCDFDFLTKRFAGPTQMRLRRLAPAALLVIVAALFLISNRGAYKGYFEDDSLQNLAFTPDLAWGDFAKGLLLPEFYPNNFRPVGHLFFRVMSQTAGLRFPPYIFFLHGLHLVNVCLIYLLLRRLGLELLPAAAGTIFFAFHMAVFDVYWRPMYVFDLLCGFFCLLSLLLYVRGRWILSFLAFWLAYRSKEVAIMLPVVLLAYEGWMGSRRWRRLIPFFAISLWFGIQALLKNQTRQNDYTLHFDPADIWKCISFYSSQVFLIPYAGLIILLLFLSRDKRILFGIATFCLLFTPMLLLPGRLYAAYLYVPLIGIAIAFAALAAHQSMTLLALFFAIWLPWNYVNMRWDRKAALAQADINRAYVTDVVKLSREMPRMSTFICDGGPLRLYGADAAIRLSYRLLYPEQRPRVVAINDPSVQAALQSKSLVVLHWDAATQHLRPLVRTPETPDESYIRMGPETPIWQLGEGWYGDEGSFRWSAPFATARLNRPPGANQFELRVNIGPLYIETLHRSHVEVALDGTPIGVHDFTQHGLKTLTWPIPPGPAGPVEVSFQVSPAYPGERPLGLAIAGFGFIP